MIKRLFIVIVVLVASGCTITPTPFGNTELESMRAGRMERIAANQQPLTQSVSLYEAMARALKYNLDHKVELMEEALSSGELDLAKWDMLPKLVGEVGYSNRSNYSGSRSSALPGANSVGAQSLVPSTSSEKDVLDADLMASWDVLDFGLSYVRAQQQADSVLIAQENRRKVANRIIEDVRTAYWRAVSSERLLSRMSGLETQIMAALDVSKREYSRRKTPPLAALTYQRELLAIQQQIYDLGNELIVAKRQLAALMNIDPATRFDLVMPNRASSLLNVQTDSNTLIETALMFRPELRAVSYRQRINRQEATTALLEMLPGLRLYAGWNNNSNEYLYNNNWVSAGAQTSWNVLNLFRYPQRMRGINAQQELLDERALALTMAVMTQVHVSSSRYELARRKLETARDYHQVQVMIAEQVSAGFTASRVSQQNFIRERMNDILAEAEYDIALADLQNAFANIYASIGLDPYGRDVDAGDSVELLAQKLETHWIERGDKTRFIR